MFADPGFVEPEFVQVLNQLEVLFERDGWVVAWRVEWRHEGAEIHSHDVVPLIMC